MAAKDYVFCKAALTGHIYLTKKIKSKDVMSQDRRIVTEEEIIGIFEHYLRGYCEENKTDTLQITDENGKVLFTATLKDIENETEN